ncbi:hypothetical protein GOBAR_AA03388 [Gossypium barbadense]|uniref:Uncharacterized protein n=1 Tax=Gossypium barbadense TaxID=3634 RepID=A0A2P5YNM1_GOSBA|nr:hypothetical protein GOBAR_AA03388 [Gossypium barbadense]
MFRQQQRPIYEERRLQIEELDKSWTLKSRTPDKLKTLNKPKSSQDEFNPSPNQLNVGDKVLLDAADPCITTSEPNKVIPLTVLNIFPYEISSENLHEPCSGNNKGPIYEERRLQIEELDEWRTQKSRTSDKSKLSQDKLNTSPNQLKVGDKVLLDATDPCITTSEPNKVIPLMRSTRPCHLSMVDTIKMNTGVDLCTGAWEKQTKQDTAVRHDRTMSSSRGKKIVVPALKKKKGAASSLGPTTEIRHLFLQIVEPTYLEFTLELCSTFHLQTVMTNFDDLRTVQFRLGGLRDLVPTSTTYDPSRSKASALPPSLRYLHAILAHTLTERRESTGVVTTHDAYFLWSMVNEHILDLAYFITLAIYHQTEQHRRGVISIGPYVTRLAWHFRLLNTAAQSSSLTLIGQMSPQGISSMLSMRMIEK